VNVNKWLQHLKIITENQILDLYIGVNGPVESARDFRYIYIYTLYVSCIVLEIGLFGKQIRITWKILKCGGGERWRRPVGPLVRE